MDELKKSIIRHEGEKRFAYKDSLGYWTIGIGRNIDAKSKRGLSDDEISMLLDNDIALCKSQIEGYTWYKNQDKVRQEALIELCFNLGVDRLLLFKNMLLHMTVKDYNNAAIQLANSKWATQVQPERVTNLIYRIRKGAYP